MTALFHIKRTGTRVYIKSTALSVMWVSVQGFKSLKNVWNALSNPRYDTINHLIKKLERVPGTPISLLQWSSNVAIFPSVGVKKTNVWLLTNQNWRSTPLPSHPFEARRQQHWAPETKSTPRGELLGHYAFQPALEHPAEPFISEPASPPFTDLLLHAIPLHCLCRTGKAHRD